MKKLTVQSLLFARKKWTAAKAAAWLKAHKYKTPPVDATADFLRYRQESPAHFRKGSFVTKDFTKDGSIKAVLAHLKTAANKTRKKATTRRTASARSSAPKANKKRNPLKFLKAQKLPAVLVLLGKAKKLVLSSGHILKLGNKLHWDLFTNKEGRKLFIFEHSQHHAPKSAAGATKAAAMYERWSQFEPDKEYTIRPRTLNDWRSDHLGVVSIVYSSDKWTGKVTSYVHHFDRPPNIMTGLDSKKILRAAIISGPHIRVTARGIEG